MNRAQACSEAIEAKSLIQVSEATAQKARDNYFRCAKVAHKIMFGDIVKHPRVRLAAEQIFENTSNPEHMKCAEAVIALAGLDSFDKVAAKRLVTALEAGERDKASIILKEHGIPYSMTGYLIVPLELLLI